MHVTKRFKLIVIKSVLVSCLAVMALSFGLLAAAPVSAAPPPVNLGGNTGKYKCGSGKSAVSVSVNFGCYGDTCKTTNPNGCSPILDATFAIIRFLSAGVGIVLIASTAWAGVQYTGSRGDPNATSQAIGRIRGNVIALLVYIFMFAILNFLIPKGFFQ